MVKITLESQLHMSITLQYLFLINGEGIDCLGAETRVYPQNRIWVADSRSALSAVSWQPASFQIQENIGEIHISSTPAILECCCQSQHTCESRIWHCWSKHTEGCSHICWPGIPATCDGRSGCMYSCKSTRRVEFQECKAIQKYSSS